MKVMDSCRVFKRFEIETQILARYAKAIHGGNERKKGWWRATQTKNKTNIVEKGFKETTNDLLAFF